MQGRTRVATLFPNEASLLRLVWAMAAEISEDASPTAFTEEVA
jgi:transposase-like protein